VQEQPQSELAPTTLRSKRIFPVLVRRVSSCRLIPGVLLIANCPSYDRQVSSIYLNAVISERMDQGLASHNRLMPILPFPRHSSNIRMLLEEEEICTPKELFVVD
jgi:hypothetical protein